MALCVEGLRDRVSSAERINLLEPLKESTIFDIVCKTPVHRPPVDVSQSRIGTKIETRPPTKICQIHLFGNGRILEEDVTDVQAGHQTSVKFEDMWIRDCTHVGVWNEGYIYTILQALNIAGRMIMRSLRHR